MVTRNPNDPCPCGSGRKYKRCHGAEAGGGRASAQPAGAATGGAAAAAGASDAFDPFARVFRDDGGVDVEYAGKRIGTLVNLLRREPMLFEFRVDMDDLAHHMLAEDARPLREAAGEEAFEAALRDFSRGHLHELAADDLGPRLRAALLEYAREAVHSRRDRAAAAIGVALLSGVPDAAGVRGRSLLDLVLRVTLEEVHALEEFRRKTREAGRPATPEELDAFWGEYPALRWYHEQRYRREVTRTLEHIEAGNLPAAISADLAMRGAHALLSEVARRRAAGVEAEPVTAHAVLRDPYEQDMLEGGREAVLERWRAAHDMDPGGSADDRRQFQRTVEGAIRLVEDAGPGADAILFYAYLRAVVQGQYYVRDADEAASARGMFTEAGLVPEGAVSFADYLERQGDAESLRRVVLAAVEIWPKHAAIRALAEKVGGSEQEKARATRQGPTFVDEAIREEER